MMASPGSIPAAGSAARASDAGEARYRIVIEETEVECSAPIPNGDALASEVRPVSGPRAVAVSDVDRRVVEVLDIHCGPGARTDLGRDTHCDIVGRHIGDHDGIRADLDAGSDGNRSEDFRAGTDRDPVA